MPLLSVIVPVYNESKTIRLILEKINSVALDKEIVVVDDASTDGTGKILRELNYPNLKVIHHTSNRGKGAAFVTGLENATGELIIIQDGDLEYNPAEYIKLLEEFKKDNVDMVLGVRFTEGYHGLLIPRLGNRFLTGLLNFLFGVRLNDFLTCYKLMAKATLLNLGLKSQRFGLEAEIVTKALKRKLKIKQVPISYCPRNYAEGKKIRMFDGIKEIVNIIKYRFGD
ncbi:MAG: glycosyltransferase family 2 protein [Candidatus Omnitrophica bacterium]|nr:glycosyltransferase family 2 protein [Candidatus Omnitrophota bacterium]